MPWPVDAGAEVIEVTFYAQAADLRAESSELDVQFCQKLLNVPRQTKATSMASQGVPEWSKGCPKALKRSPKSAQGEKKRVEGHPKEANKAQNYIHINKIYANSRSTAIQRPASTAAIDITNSIVITIIMNSND